MAWFWEHYVPDTALRGSPDAAPLLADDLSGLPPALVLIAEHDPLRDEGAAYAWGLAAAGVDVTVDRYETMIHGFFPLVGLLDAADEAVAAVGLACSRALSPEPEPEPEPEPDRAAHQLAEPAPSPTRR